jgi:raffinose/stachyose/melibiose transport system permease protein
MIPFEAIVIPLYYNLRDIGLTDTYWALILPESALQLSFGIYWMRSFFLAVPRELIEAARVDGARTLRTLVSVLIPIARPAITTMMVLLFMFSWNEFLLPLVMVDSSDATRTAPLGLANFQGRYGTDIPSLAAGSLLVALPVLVLYVFLNRRFIQGVLSGAIKE